MRSDAVVVEAGPGTRIMRAAAAGAPGAPRERRRRRSRAQAMVEFALVAPLFFTLFFGIIEYSAISFSVGSMNYAAVDAARLGSVKGSTDPNVDCEIIADVQTRTSGIVMAKVTKVEIFHANPDGTMVTSQDNVYTSLNTTSDGCSAASPWTPTSRQEGLFDADYLGVRVTYNYTYLTGFVAGGSGSLQMTAVSVQRVEPQSFGYAAPAPGRGGAARAADSPAPAGAPVAWLGAASWPDGRAERGAL